jgi:hypothetical protein
MESGRFRAKAQEIADSAEDHSVPLTADRQESAVESRMARCIARFAKTQSRPALAIVLNVAQP